MAMASKDSWFRKLTWATARETLSNLVWSNWSIIGAPVVTGGLVYFEGYSLTFIFLFCLGAFAMVALGVNQLSQWQAAKSPEGKLQFGGHTVGVKINEKKDGFPAVLGIKLGLSLVSKAQFPLEAEVKELETQIRDRVPKEPFFPRTIPIGMGGGGHFTNAIIDLEKDISKNAVFSGSIKAKLRYGRPGNLKYEMERNLYLALMFDERGNLASTEASITELKIE